MSVEAMSASVRLRGSAKIGAWLVFFERAFEAYSFGGRGWFAIWSGEMACQGRLGGSNGEPESDADDLVQHVFTQG